jgi:diguanylate cyclase (GGDEF)-like protein
MQLARLTRFSQHLAENLHTIGAKRFDLFYFWDNEWRTLSPAPTSFTTVERLAELERTKRSTDRHHRRAKDSRSYYWIEAIDVVVCIETATPTIKTTRTRTLVTLGKLLAYAHATFDARHDDLTGLNNRRAFHETVRARLSVRREPTSIEHQNRAPTESVQCLLSIDIDHFKQINDSYGHPYGDDVLRCFASRLSSLVDRLNSSEIYAYCARLGGEEFAIFLDGKATRLDVTKIADSISTLAGREGLFTEPEWRHQASSTSRALEARIVTASVGISSIGTAQENEDSPSGATNRLTRLTSEADQALYRAKQGGRKCHRFFGDIRDQYGVILERHEGTSIVCADIGKRVDVAIGNEFLVFHPDFQGGRPLEFFDGRSRRELGRRPRVHSGRIVVFDVQDEISFANIKGGVRNSV